MNSILSTKVLLRKDTAERWEQFNPLLLNGETAIVVEKDGNVRLKVGDGEKTYNQLPFLHEYAVETQSINQGMQAFARPYGIAGGFRVSADSQFAQAFGINASTSGDNYSFVWNGDNDLLKDAYTAHGDGTFNINPVNGLSGFYINDRNLSNIIYTEIERKSTTFVNGEKKDLSVFQVSLSDYIKAVNTSSLLSDAVYIVSSDIRYMFGERISDLGEPELSSDAATKNYVDTEINQLSLIQVSEDGGETFSKADQLLLINIGAEEYHELVKSGNTLSNAIYEVDYENDDCFGERLINVGEPLDDSDAATKHYVDQRVGAVKIPTKTSELINNSGFLTAHQSLSSYYTKDQVNEISTDLAGKSVVRLSIPENRIQQDLSVLNIVKLTKSKYQQLEQTGQILSSNLYVIEVEDNDIIFGGNSFTC